MATAGVVALGLAAIGPVSAHATTATTNAALTANTSYVSVTPARVEDTRTSTALAGGATLNVQVTGGTSGVPAGAVAAVLNVTAVDPTAAGFLTVFPEGTTRPTVSNLNFAAGTIVPNLVTVALSASGMVSIYLNTGSSNVLVDVEGYYAPETTSGLYNPLSPSRAFGSLTIGGAIGAGVTTAVTVAGGTSGVPTTASAVVLNVTAAHATLPSFLTVFPAGGTRPTASNLNFGAQAPQQAIANRVTVGVGTSGQIDVYNLTGTVNVDVDVDGYYSGTGGVGSPFVAITPIRVADTETGANHVGSETSIPAPPPQAAATETFTLATADIPANSAGVAMNLTVIPGNKPGYLTSYPTSDTTPPVASDVNWTASESPAVPNFTIADTTGTGAAQNVKVANSYFTTGATVDVIADAFGYFAPTTAAGTYTVTGGGTVPVSTCTNGDCSDCFIYCDGTEHNSASVTNTSDNKGVVDYTASGFAAGASVNLALFPSVGANAPTQPYYFTPSTADTASYAAGEGTSNNSTEGVYEGAYINTVNGVAATCGYLNENYECDGITANSSGAITFSLDSFYPDGTVPVVWTIPASAGTDTDLYVNADGTPQTGYEVGIGSSTTWGAPAPAATTGDYYDYAVESVNPTAGTFVACYSEYASQSSVETATGDCNTFTYQSGDTYYYEETGVDLLQSQFTSYLSAASPAYTSNPAVRGDWFDEIDYNPGASYYYYYLDVPAAPTGVTATPITSGPYAGDTSINWTAPINPDVDNYAIYEATESTTGTYDWTTATNVTSVCDYETVSGTNCDITTPGKGTYEFEVKADDTSYKYYGPFSAPTAPYTVTLPATPAPVIDSVIITPSLGGATVTTPGYAVVTYNEDVTCASAAGADFSYSDSGAGIGSVKGATCGPDTLDSLVITFPSTTVVGTVTTQDVILAPGTGDTFTYTAPSLDTTLDAAYAGTSSAPSYEANQTVTDNGDPTPTSNTGTATLPSNPLI